MSEIKPQLRPLRRVRAGVWKSRDGRWTFTGPAALGHLDNELRNLWHIHDDGSFAAYADPEPLLSDAVACVAYVYADLETAPDDARERILDAIRKHSTGMIAIPTLEKMVSSMPSICTSAWVYHMIYEGSLIVENHGIYKTPFVRIAE